MRAARTAGRLDNDPIFSEKNQDVTMWTEREEQRWIINQLLRRSGRVQVLHGGTREAPG